MRSFNISPEEQATINEWLTEHNKTCKFYDDGTKPSSPQGAIGGAYTYCFTPTGIGLITIFKCVCGEEVNVTDFDSW